MLDFMLDFRAAARSTILWARKGGTTGIQVSDGILFTYLVHQVGSRVLVARIVALDGLQVLVGDQPRGEQRVPLNALLQHLAQVVRGGYHDDSTAAHVSVEGTAVSRAPRVVFVGTDPAALHLPCVWLAS